MISWFVTFWNGLTPDMQAEIVGAAVTVITFTGGVLLVIWQIGRQARDARTANREAEQQKLKLQIYEQIVASCAKASDAEIALSSYVRQYAAQVTHCRYCVRVNIPSSPPTARARSLLDTKTNQAYGAIELICITERWQIIDPRMEVFRTGINVASHNIDAAWHKYFDIAIRIVPLPIQPNPTGSDDVYPWKPPDDAGALKLEETGQELIHALGELGSYISDFQLEMQNSLLGDLFGRKLSARKPIDPKLVVIELDKHKELTQFFETQTTWGRYKASIENQVRESLKSKNS